MARRALIIGGPRNSKKLVDILSKEGYDVESTADCVRAVDLARMFTPDVVLMDVNLPCDDPLSVAPRIIAERPVPIVMHSSHSEIDQVLRADEMGVSAHLFRPITRENLLGAIELGMSRFRQCQLLRAEVTDCKEALRIRKLVERAKGILMKRNSLTEEEAFLKLQRLSRDSNMKMEKVAESIITANEIM